MLTELEFRTKRHIILDKGVETFVMNRDIRDDRWHICSITRDPGDFSCHIYDMEEAWAFYVNRMSSYGFKQFPVIVDE